MTALDPAGRLREPVAFVPLDSAGPDDVDAALRDAGVVVGVSRGGPPDPAAAAACDLTLTAGAAPREAVAVPDVDAAVAALADRVGACPQAAGVLAGLLRWSGQLPAAAALEAESLAYSTLLAGPEFAAWLARRGPRPQPPPVPEPVLVDRTDGELRITLNRPERRNAYGRALRDALVDALAVAELDPTVDRVVLDAAGPDFCSGGDLDEFGTAADPVTAHLVRTRAGAALPLARLGPRVEARLHGSCVGAGIELPAWGGRVLAAPGTRFVLPELAMGLLPGAGGTVSIPRRIGRWRTLWLALSGAALDVTTALEWGLVDEITETEENR
ncbi:enoyl-CoA hydratase/isomerase family protein [Geodermatophilus sp. URMC 64]